MKFLALLRADSVHILIRFPAAIAVLGICLFAFLVTLPQGLFENGIAKISVAVVYGGQEEAADIFVNILRDLDPVKRLVRTDAQEAQVLLDEGDVDLVLELPSGII
ncbi:MAG: hypothetical protein FWE68_03460, partial [Defluviitaleaceae bacterium]|nr:hypothetical protein [Defluviitaleaceae bacterium]